MIDIIKVMKYVRRMLSVPIVCTDKFGGDNSLPINVMSLFILCTWSCAISTLGRRCLLPWNQTQFPLRWMHSSLTKKCVEILFLFFQRWDGPCFVHVTKLTDLFCEDLKLLWFSCRKIKKIPIKYNLCFELWNIHQEEKRKEYSGLLRKPEWIECFHP